MKSIENNIQDVFFYKGVSIEFDGTDYMCKWDEESFRTAYYDRMTEFIDTFVLSNKNEQDAKYISVENKAKEIGDINAVLYIEIDETNNESDRVSSARECNKSAMDMAEWIKSRILSDISMHIGEKISQKLIDEISGKNLFKR